MDSGTHFRLANMDFGDTAELKNWLIENYGILIRDASNFHGLDNRCFRVSAQTVKENEALIDSLKEYLRNF
jgi:threonine-phosphate decarboxylase